MFCIYISSNGETLQGQLDGRQVNSRLSEKLKKEQESLVVIPHRARVKILGTSSLYVGEEMVVVHSNLTESTHWTWTIEFWLVWPSRSAEGRRRVTVYRAGTVASRLGLVEGKGRWNKRYCSTSICAVSVVDSREQWLQTLQYNVGREQWTWNRSGSVVDLTSAHRSHARPAPAVLSGAVHRDLIFCWHHLYSNIFPSWIHWLAEESKRYKFKRKNTQRRFKYFTHLIVSNKCDRLCARIHRRVAEYNALSAWT